MSFPPELFANTHLEELDIELPRFPDEIEPLRRLPLRRLRIGFVDESRMIPHALFEDLVALPKLEELDLGFTRMPRGIKATLVAPLVRGLAAMDAAPDVRRLHARLLLGKVDDLVKSDVAHPDLLSALDCNVAPVRSTALTVLSRIVPKPEIPSGSEVALVGLLHLDRDVVAERLAAKGSKLVRKAGKSTTHLLVGEKPNGKWKEPLARGLVLVLEEHLPKEGFLGDDASERIAELLSSEDSGNVALAIEMMKSGGVPSGVFEELFLAYQRTALDDKVRTAAKKLFFAHAPLELRTAVEKNLRGTSIFFSGGTKTKARIKTLVKESKGTLDGTKLAILVGCLKYVFDEVKDPKVHLACLEKRRNGAELSLIKKELSRLPNALAQVEGVTKLDLSANHFATIPDVVFELGDLGSLDVSSNPFEELPRALAKLQKLERLSSSGTRLRAFPSVVFSLPLLRRLDLSTERYGLRCPFSEIPAAIESLVNLEELSLEAHTFTTLPRELLALPKLRRLNLASAEIKELPEWVAELPAIAELDVRWVDTDNAALDRVEQELASRGVLVLR